MKKQTYVVEVAVLYNDLSYDELTKILQFQKEFKSGHETMFGEETDVYGSKTGMYWAKFKDECYMLTDKANAIKTSQNMIERLDNCIF